MYVRAACGRRPNNAAHAHLVEALFVLGGALPGTAVGQPPHRGERVEPLALDLGRVVVRVARGVELHGGLVGGQEVRVARLLEVGAAVRRALFGRRVVVVAGGELPLGVVVASHRLVRQHTKGVRWSGATAEKRQRVEREIETYCSLVARSPQRLLGGSFFLA